MLEVNYENALTTPKWKDDDSLEVEFSFRNGNKTTVKIDTAGKSQLSIDDMKNQLLGKLKLLRNMCEHGTHGYIEVQGFIARADDLIAMKIR